MGYEWMTESVLWLWALLFGLLGSYSLKSIQLGPLWRSRNTVTGNDNPSLRLLKTARFGLQWKAPGEDTCLKTGLSKGWDATVAWRAATPKRMGLSHRECLLLAQTYSPRSLTVFLPATCSLSKKRAALRATRSPGKRKHEHVAQEREGELTWFHLRSKLRAYKTRHCVPKGWKIQPLLDPLTQASPSSLPWTQLWSGGRGTGQGSTRKA